jgi:hypothetical protein
VKTGFVLVSVLSAIVLSASAPCAFAGETTFGIKAGLSFSSAAGGPDYWDDSIEWKTGMTAGAFLNHALSENFSLQPEFIYTQKGFGSALLEDLLDIGLTFSIDYVEIPVLAKYTFSAGKNFRPALYAGPSFAYCLGSELSFSWGIFSGDIDFSSLTHTTDFLIVLGGGFDYAAGGGTLVVDARFTYGFTNVIMSGDFEINGSTETIMEDDFKNYGLSLTIGYAF